MVSDGIPPKCRAQDGHVAAFCRAHASVVRFFGGGAVAQTVDRRESGGLKFDWSRWAYLVISFSHAQAHFYVFGNKMSHSH